MPTELNTLEEISEITQLVEKDGLGSGELKEQIPAQVTAEIRRDGVQRLADKGVDVFSVLDAAERTFNEGGSYAEHCIKSIKNHTAKVLCEDINIDSCVTVYGTSCRFPKNGIQSLEERYSHLGTVRKDIILVDAFLNSEINNPSEENKLTPEQTELLKNDVLHVYKDYGDLKKSWTKENKPKNKTDPMPQCDSEVLINWYMDNQNHLSDENTSEHRKSLIKETLSVVERDDEKIVKSYLDRGIEPTYTALAMPDELVIDKNGKVVSAIKLLPYSNQEIQTWFENLKKAKGNLENLRDGEDYNTENITNAGFYDLRGSEVNILKPTTNNPTGVRMGVNFDGIRKFINLANGEKIDSIPTVDGVDIVTGEIFPADSKPKIILRFPSDSDPQLLRQIGKFFEDELKEGPVVEQLVPYSNNDIGQASYAAFRHFGIENENDSRKEKFVNKHAKIVKRLERADMWYEKGK